MALLSLYPLRMTPHRLLATDIVHTLPLALVAGLGYQFAGMVDWWMLASLLLVSIPTMLGSLLVVKMFGRWIQVSWALILLSASIKF